MIFIVLKVDIRSDKREDWLAGIAEYTANVRQEPGNIAFDCFESLDTPHQFSILESFADSDAGAAHVGTEHAKKFFAWFPSVLAATPKIIYQDLGDQGWSEMAEVSPEQD